MAGIPSLGLPFLSDDWSHAIAASEGTIRVTPFGYFRPLCSLSYWIDWQIWGPKPAGFRLTGLLLAAFCAALVVVVVRRYTGDAALAQLAGVVFALHPYHIGAIGWIAARSDLLSAAAMLSAAWCFERWSDRPRALPWATIALYELALLAKEGSVTLPAFLLLAAVWQRRRRIAGSAWLRAFLPLVLVGLAHFTWVRAAALGGVALGPLKWLGAWRGNLLAYGASSVVPLPPETFQAMLWPIGGIAALVAVVLLLVARLRTGKLPAVIWPAGIAFVVLLGPSLIGFVQRYYFLPSAAAALALAALLRSAGARIGGSIAAVLAAVWIGTAVATWVAWFDAGAASRTLIAGLVEAGAEAGIETIVVAGAPHRVHGVPVTTAYARVVPFVGGRKVKVLTAAEFDFPAPQDDALVGTPVAVPGAVRLELRVRSGPYSRLVVPSLDEGASLVVEDGLTLVGAGPQAMSVLIEPRGKRRAFVWAGGVLAPL